MDSRIPLPSMTLFSILKVKISHTKYLTTKGQKKIWNVIFSAHHEIYTLKHDISYFTFDNVKWSDCFFFFFRYAHCRNDKEAEFQYKAGNFNFYPYITNMYTIDTFMFLHGLFLTFCLYFCNIVHSCQVVFCEIHGKFLKK